MSLLALSACCHWTAENVDLILEFGDKMNLDSLQFRKDLYPIKKRFNKQSPFRCILDCREQQSGQLAATLKAILNKRSSTAIVLPLVTASYKNILQLMTTLFLSKF